MKQGGATDVRGRLSLNSYTKIFPAVFVMQYVYWLKDSTNCIIKVRKLTVCRIFAVTEVEIKHHYREVCYFCLDGIPRQIQFVSSTFLSHHARYALYNHGSVAKGE